MQNTVQLWSVVRALRQAATDVLMAFSFKSLSGLHGRVDSRDGRVSKQTTSEERTDSPAVTAAAAASTSQTLSAPADVDN